MPDRRSCFRCRGEFRNRVHNISSVVFNDHQGKTGGCRCWKASRRSMSASHRRYRTAFWRRARSGRAAVDGLAVGVVAGAVAVDRTRRRESTSRCGKAGLRGRVRECRPPPGAWLRRCLARPSTPCAPRSRSTMRSPSSCSIRSVQAGPTAGLLHAPLPIVGEELACIRRQVIRDRAPIPAGNASARGRRPADNPERSTPDIGGTHPQSLPDE
jgi:hypothetical protein